MRNNPYPDDPTQAQRADLLPHQMERMEDLPLRPAAAPGQPQVNPENAPDVESAETRLEEARTVRYAIGKLNDFLQWFLAVLEVSLAIRFILRLIGADANNMFAGFLYALTEIILFPFSSIVKDPVFRQNQAFEWSTLIAMAIYYLIFWAIRRFLHILISGPEESS